MENFENMVINIYDTDEEWLGLIDIDCPEPPTPSERDIIEAAAGVLVRQMHQIAIRSGEKEQRQKALTAARLGRLFSLTLNNEADIEMSKDLMDEIDAQGYRVVDEGEGNISLERTANEDPYVDISVMINTMTTVDA